jgi:hypothetical protein
MAAMKLAVVPLPNERGCEFVMKEGEVPPPIFFFNRSKQAAVLGALLLCALTLFYTAYFAGGKRTLATIASTAAAQVTEGTQRFDGTRRLKQGELVVLDGAGSSKVRQVAAAPKEAVLLRQGNSLRALFMTGEKKYVVISGNETRIVPANQIHSIVSPAGSKVAP